MKMLKILSAPEFKRLRREPLLDYSLYADEAADLAIRIPRIGLRLADAEWMSTKSAADAMRMTRSRARHAVDLLTLGFSAGLPVAELKALYPGFLDFWDEYARYAKAFDNSHEYGGSWVAHFGLLGDDYAAVNRMTCFGILFGHTELLPRLTALLEYRNPRMDGMLERLFAPFVPGRPPAPDDCTRHLPYFKTLKIFEAAKEERPSMMADYLAEWYHASRREPYYESHKRENFQGYWAWEAAAITFLLDIDDTSYHHASFYPGDLVEFARANAAGTPPGQATPNAPEELRCKAGETCPVSGKWETLSLPAASKIFQKGDMMSASATPYGITVWVYKGEA